MSVKLLTERHLEFLSLNEGCRGSSEYTLVKYHIVGNHVSRLIFVWFVSYEMNEIQRSMENEPWTYETITSSMFDLFV